MTDRILLSNDDGIDAEGLSSLKRIALAMSDDIWVVAPETEQSGASHSLSLHEPVRLRKEDERHFAVTGTPTDCVLLALKHVIPVTEKPVSLMLSGINRGSNAADDITYSGTVAAAMEANILGVPAIALSLLTTDTTDPHWETPEKYAPDLIRKLVKQGWPASSFINLNFPNCPPDRVKGVRVCAQGKRKVGVNLLGRVDLKGRPYFWIGGERDHSPNKPGVDVDMLHRDYITITPINMDLTDYKTLEALTTIMEEGR